MKISQISIAALLSVAAVGAFAQAKAPEPDYTISFNAGLVTDYRYRGITQTRFKPAVQGGIDFVHKNGFYAGAWGSNIQWIKDAGRIGATDVGSSNLEIDIYGGYKGSINKDIGFDVGALHYWYPSNKFNNLTAFNTWPTPKADTTEVYGALTFGPVTAKYSHAVTTLFGNANSKGSGYLDLTANFDLGNGWTVTPHIGNQRVSGTPAAGFPNSNYSYTDYSVAVSKDFGNGFVGTASVVGTNAKKNAAGTPFYGAPDAAGGLSPASKNLGRSGVVVGVKYNF